MMTRISAARTPSADDTDDHDKSKDVIELQRREYLRRHQEVLLQKQRLETVRSPRLLYWYWS